MSDDSLYVVHGGSDFDKINPSRFGSGEPGGIRPLGKGLYSFVIDHEDPKRAAYAIDYAKRYSKKYGYGSNAVHVFKIPKSISTSWNGSNDIDRTKNPEYPKKIEGLGGYPEKEYADFKAVDAKYQATKGTPEEGDSWNHAQRAYEKLKESADVRFEHLPIGLTEASIHNPEIATRIGKFDLDTPTEDILGMVKNDAANVPHKDDGGSVGHIENHSSAIAEAMQNHFGVPVSVSKSKTPYGESHYVKPQFDLPKGETPFNIRVSDHGAWVPRLHKIEHQVYPKKGDNPEKFIDESIDAAKKYGQRVGLFPKDEFVPLKGEVYHPTFGKGTIVDSQPDSAKVDFGDKGVKNISSRFLQEVPHKDNGGGITAYQGGPHSVGEEGYQDDKIGTGEGAQAYGYGHYFAEAEPVAQGYRDALVQKRNPTTSINDLISQMSKNSPESRTPKNIQWYMKQDPMLSPHADDREVVGHISEALNGQNADGSVSESAIDAYGKLTDKFGRNHKGHMHEVSINAHPDHFLDWDKPLSEQSDHVQNAFNSHKDLIHSNPYLDTFFDNIVEHRDGAEIYNELSHKNAVGLGDKGASNFLSSMGIHGIKYLDANSRSKGEGTRNYVVFNPKRVDIKRRYKDGGEIDDDGITAYHGSPHDFDQFDMAKIGGGSGVQNFGHGLYFAEHEPAAEGYRYSLQQLANVMVGKEDANQINKGHMYEVNISAHPDHMLDWDKPLSEQSPHIVKSIFDARKDNPTLFNVFKSHLEKDSTGMDFYQALATKHPNGNQGASEFLQRSGIHGVKYRDVTRQGMKDGKPTTNYVVFDPKNVDVKRKYEQGGEVLAHDDPRREKNLAAFQEGNHPDVPHVLYHGTKRNFDTFNLNAPSAGDSGVQHTDVGFFGKGFYFAGPNAASGWSESGKPEEGSGPNVMPVHLSIKNPFIVTHPDSSSGAMAMQHSLARLGHGHITSPTAQTELLKKLGHDGVIAARTEDGKTTPYEWVAFHPHQIKSAIGNNGNFDPSKPNIKEARGGRIGYDYGGDVRTGDNPGGAADANRPAATSRDADRNYNAGSGTQYDNTADKVMDRVQRDAGKEGASDLQRKIADDFLNVAGAMKNNPVVPQEENMEELRANYLMYRPSKITQPQNLINQNDKTIVGGFKFENRVPSINEPIKEFSPAEFSMNRIRQRQENYVPQDQNPIGGMSFNPSLPVNPQPQAQPQPQPQPQNQNNETNIPLPPQRGDDSYFGNMGGNIGSVLGGLAFGPLGSIGGRYLGNQFNQPDNSRFEAKNDEFGNPIGNSGGWLDFLGNSGNPPAPITSDNRRDPIKQKCKIFNPDGSCKEFEGGMKSGGVAKSYNRVHNSKIVEHALSKVGVSLHVHRPPS